MVDARPLIPVPGWRDLVLRKPVIAWALYDCGNSAFATSVPVAGFMETVKEFHILARAIGCAQGGVFSLSRSYFARLIPEGKTAEFFGFYNMIGKFAVLGPFLVAAAAAISGSTRSAIVAIVPLLLLGELLLFLNRHDDTPQS
jgi:MFS-type transporter involved in bile tolerance (Atg22 family)